jgi:hypothetical protein
VALAIAEESRNQFEWGRADCFVLAARVAEAVTGVNYASRFAGKYRDEATAREYLNSQGGLVAMMTREFGPPSPPDQCVDGDLVVVQLQGGDQALGVVFSGGQVVVVRTAKFVRMLPLSFGLYFWRVPCLR